MKISVYIVSIIYFHESADTFMSDIRYQILIKLSGHMLEFASFCNTFSPTTINIFILFLTKQKERNFIEKGKRTLFIII